MAQAAAALGRCLYWQGRSDEAAGVLRGAGDACGSPADAARVALTMARVHLSEGAIPPAVRAARHARDLAAASGEPRTLASASRVLAAAVAAAGDTGSALGHIREGLRAAKEAHLPLAAVRLRLTWADILIASGAPLEAQARGRQAGGHRGPAAAAAEIPGPCGPRARERFGSRRGDARVRPRLWRVRASTSAWRDGAQSRCRSRSVSRSGPHRQRRSHGARADLRRAARPAACRVDSHRDGRPTAACSRSRPAVARRSACGLARARQRAERGGGPFRRAVSGGRAPAVRRRADRRRRGALDRRDACSTRAARRHCSASARSPPPRTCAR